MGYKDTIECPHCHMAIDLEIEIEGDDGYMDLYPMVLPKSNENKEGGKRCEVSGKEA